MGIPVRDAKMIAIDLAQIQLKRPGLHFLI